MLCYDGCIALSDGCSIPGNIPGRWIKDCLNEWNHQNAVTVTTTNPLLVSVHIVQSLLLVTDRSADVTL